MTIMTPRWLITGAALALTICSSVSSAAQLYISPTGTPDAPGTQAQPLDLTSGLSDKSSAKPGDTIYLMPGRYDGKMKGIERLAFEIAVSGTVDKPVTICPLPGSAPGSGGVHLNGTVLLSSSYALIRDLEIGDLDWNIDRTKHHALTALNVMGGTATKVVNCNIFGGEMGTGLWTPAVDFEIYGCLVHDFGYAEEGGARGHGHAFYTQNEHGTKTIASNVAYRGEGWNLHVYGKDGKVSGYDVLDNIMYIAGSRFKDQSLDNYLVSAYTVADRIRLINNVGYQPLSMNTWRPNMRMSTYGKGVVNGTGVVKDNDLMGSANGLFASPWNDLTVTGNTIWATKTLVTLEAGLKVAEAAKAYKFDNNTYLGETSANLFKAGGELSFSQWQQLGFDANSKLLATVDGKPTGSKVFVFPNTFESGRGNVGIFNWDGAEKIEVDLSKILKPGQAYSVYNCLDIHQTLAQAKPVLTGKYASGTIYFPMRKDAISPNFDAFLVLPVASN